MCFNCQFVIWFSLVAAVLHGMEELIIVMYLIKLDQDVHGKNMMCFDFMFVDWSFFFVEILFFSFHKVHSKRICWLDYYLVSHFHFVSNLFVCRFAIETKISLDSNFVCRCCIYCYGFDISIDFLSDIWLHLFVGIRRNSTT